ncbi:hypothetical protein FACS1894217_02840 [Clostridia bacterium]|nr:hypothetical protein FACS1894217_02840 [Clostridia bacterium]
MGNIFEGITTKVEEMLDNSYLFDHENKRLTSNLQMLLVVLALTQLINGIAAIAVMPAADTAVAAIMPLLMCAALVWTIPKIQSPKVMLFVMGTAILVLTWNQLFVSNAGFFSLLWVAVYPIAICFFMGNRFALPYLTIMLINVLFYVSPVFEVWRDMLQITRSFDGSTATQFVFGFICACVFGLMLEYMHDRTTVHLALLANRITENSYRDPLTKLLARRAFYERYCTEVEAHGQKKPLFLVMCDVDHFKAVNDTYGHAIGDEILKHVSNILMQNSMGKLCFRWGGEEFILFLEDPTLDKAISSANKIRVVLEHTPYMDAQIGSIRATMSFGVHAYDKTLTMDKNISVVDEYLYEAKRKGRNRVESIASKEPEDPTI